MIVLGDVCDRHREVGECIDELLQIDNCDYIIGNHDLWTLDWVQKGVKDELWLKQGGMDTIASYEKREMPQAHIDFLSGGCAWIVFDNKLFVHGGFNHEIPIEKQDFDILAWDRDLIRNAVEMNLQDKKYKFGGYEEVYIGHTPTDHFGSDKPLHFCNVWDMDTGAGHGGKLTIMNVATKKFWQSDPTSVLYDH